LQNSPAKVLVMGPGPTRGEVVLCQAYATTVFLIRRPADPSTGGRRMPVLDWAARLLRCTECGAQDADFIVSGERR